MTYRKTLAAVASVAVVASALAFAAPAGAATTTHDADDPSFDGTSAVLAADLVGVGSDTSQHTLHLLGEAWNAQSPAPAFRIASFAATSGGQIGLPTADVNRPNGSGAGKTTLWNPSNPDIDFARSSSTLSDAEKNAGLQQFPFALDTLQMAVSNSVASHAPTALTGAQIVSIYKCEPSADNWSDFGATAGAILPLIPQAGSGTRGFFEGQLKSLNGGTAVTLGPCVKDDLGTPENPIKVQEHDDTLIKNNPDAIAPFSEGRAALLGTTLRLLDPTIANTQAPGAGPGWHADRALYNVVRAADLSDADIQAVFGENGFVCSNEARDLIAQSGFKQLATASHDGVCGVATQSATSNFTLNQQVVTTTTLAATSPSAGVAHLVATVTAATAPSGTVTFYEGETNLGSAPLTQGQAVLDLPAQTAGVHTYVAKFAGETSTVEPSQDEATVTVKAASTTTIAFTPSTSTYGKSRVVKATVLTGGVPATGTVAIKVGAATAVNVALVNGIASLTVGATKAAGTYAVAASYKGNVSTATSTATKSLVIAKATPVITESFPTATTVGGRGKGTVKLAISGSTVKPTGSVKIYKGTTLIAQGTLSSGAVTITLPRLARGTHTLTIKYAGSASVKAGSKSFSITQR